MNIIKPIFYLQDHHKFCSSEICDDFTICSEFATVFLASVIIPVVLGGPELSQWPVLIWGIINTVAFTHAALLFGDIGKI
jgi:hypothetical protein